MKTYPNTLVAEEGEDYDLLDIAPVRVPQTPKVTIHEWFELVRRAGGRKEDALIEIKKNFGEFTQQQLSSLNSKWEFWARPNQLAPAIGSVPWVIWVLLAGRGFGKTRTGAEWINERVQQGLAKRIALVAPTAADVRKTMVEGESGILAISPPWNRPLFEPSKLQLTWPNNAIAQLFSAEEPERLRGPQFDTFWADELAAWKKLVDTWDMLQFGFRLGDMPQGCITTTPKPLKLLKEILADERSLANPTGSVVVTRGTTYDNMANLSPVFYSKTVKKYEGTRIGRQELEALILDDMPGALWQRSNVDANRIKGAPPFPSIIIQNPDELPGERSKIEDVSMLRRVAEQIIKLVPEDLSRVIVAVDPNASNDEGSDEIGIVVAAKGVSGHGYVLADLSMRGSPNEWATTAILGHDAFGADRVIGEANQGGNMVEYTLTTSAKSLKMEKQRNADFVGVTLVHATRGKVTRAEPVAALYEQNRISHVGALSTLEDQMCLFTTDFDRNAMGYSPDRVDALVWALTHLFLEENETGFLEFLQEQVDAREKAALKRADPEDRVRMCAPSGVSTAYGMTGTRYEIVDGKILAHEDDVAGFRNGGFVVV